MDWKSYGGVTLDNNFLTTSPITQFQDSQKSKSYIIRYTVCNVCAQRLPDFVGGGGTRGLQSPFFLSSQSF